MGATGEIKKDVKKFAGIEIPPDLTRANFFFLYVNTVLMGLVMAVSAIIQPAFLSDMIKIKQDFAGSINGLLQNMSQIATLAFVAIIGVLSDKLGRKILAILGFIVIAVFIYLMSQSNGIASSLTFPPDFPPRYARCSVFSRAGLLNSLISLRGCSAPISPVL